MSEKEIHERNQEIENWWKNLDEQFKSDIYYFFKCIKIDLHNSNFPKLCKLNENNYCDICFRKVFLE